MGNPTYTHLRADEPLPMSEGMSPYKAVLVIEQGTSGEWRGLVCEWLVGSGCRYMMAWGQDCEIWHDSVDGANLARLELGEFPDEDSVITTWHPDESLAEVFWFAENCADHPDVDLSHILIIHISPEAREAELIQGFDKAQAGDV
jgi:hypothetical protein